MGCTVVLLMSDQPLEGCFIPCLFLSCQGVLHQAPVVSVGQISPRSGGWLVFISNKSDLSSAQLALGWNMKS